MSNKKDEKKLIILLILMITFTVVGYLTIYPTVLPLYQRRLFTVFPTNFNLKFNGFFTLLCILISTKQIMRYKSTRFISDLILFDLNLFYFFPGFLMNAIFLTDNYFTIYYALFWLFLSAFGLVMPIICKKKPIVVCIGNNPKYEWFYNSGIVILFSSIILLVSLYYSNFNINITSLFKLNEVLEQRATSAELNIHWLIWYPVLCGSMILPIWFTRAKKNNKIWQMILIVISMCAMFSIGANRIFLFMLFFSIVISFFPDDDLLILKGLIIVLAIVCLEYYISTDYPVMNTVRRILVTPNGESRFYVDYFQNHNADWCRQLLERWLLPFGFVSKYHNRIPAMIGLIYLGGSNCNTGLVGYSIANFGSAGIVIGPFLYIISFAILNRITCKIKYKKMIQTMAIIVTLEITNCYGWSEYLILPSFLLLFYLLIFLMPADTELYEGKKKND